MVDISMVLDDISVFAGAESVVAAGGRPLLPAVALVPWHCAVEYDYRCVYSCDAAAYAVGLADQYG